METGGYALILFLGENSIYISVFRGWAGRFMNRSGIERLLGGFRVCLEQFVARDGLGLLPGQDTTDNHGVDVTCLYMV